MSDLTPDPRRELQAATAAVAQATLALYRVAGGDATSLIGAHDTLRAAERQLASARERLRQQLPRGTTPES